MNRDPDGSGDGDMVTFNVKVPKRLLEGIGDFPDISFVSVTSAS
ncbi:MAG: hypothetical protein ABEI98_00390 [Halorhabdus sp.]